MRQIIKHLLVLPLLLMALFFGCGSGDDSTGPEYSTVSDIDGNIYHTVRIGEQLWMVENLRVTHYCNGDPIQCVIDDGTWSQLSSAAYCNYNNDESYVDLYGRIYNWYAAVDSRNIAPQGWHVPSDAEWKQLEMYLGMSQAEANSTDARGTDEGGKLKATGISQWNSPNAGATNETGFAAQPGGCRYVAGTFHDMGNNAYFLTSSDSSSTLGWHRALYYHLSQIARTPYDKKAGLSVRCVKD